MAEAPVLFEVRDHVATLTLNRPDNRNSMTPDLLDAFTEVVQRVRRAPDLRCVVIAGSGTTFSSGADFRSQIQRDDGGQRQPHERSFAMYQPFLSVLDIEVPVVGALTGHAVGGGFGLALLCDIRIATRDARYGANFARIGLHPGLGISYLLPRLVGTARAAELLYTGRLFSGSDGADMGLFTRALPIAEVLPEAQRIAAEIAGNAPIAVRSMKQALSRQLASEVRAAAWQESFAQSATVQTEDAREGIAALLEKRTPQFRNR